MIIFQQKKSSDICRSFFLAEIDRLKHAVASSKATQAIAETMHRAYGLINWNVLMVYDIKISEALSNIIMQTDYVNLLDCKIAFYNENCINNL